MMIGKMIRIYLAINKLSVCELGEQLGLSGSTISRIERGKDIDQKTMLILINWLFSKEKEND